MEDKIKALIEKYEAITLSQSDIDPWQVQVPCDVVLDDLKQLLTTSQGNPERMV